MTWDMYIAESKKTDLTIIGAGILGSSIAYYYKRDNPDKEEVVYDQNELCSGSTSVAAALMMNIFHMCRCKIKKTSG
jgi:glycine/D-amino acid oxidase-like deaminating enzyme